MHKEGEMLFKKNENLDRDINRLLSKSLKIKNEKRNFKDETNKENFMNESSFK